MDNSERMVGGLYMPDPPDETTPRRALFKIKPVSNLGPWRKWVVCPSVHVALHGSCQWTAYAHTLPEAFKIVSRWLSQEYE